MYFNIISLVETKLKCKYTKEEEKGKKCEKSYLLICLTILYRYCDINNIYLIWLDNISNHKLKGIKITYDNSLTIIQNW